MIDIGLTRAELTRCPFVRALAEDREDDARALAQAGDDGVDGPVLDWLVTEARGQWGIAS